MKIDDRIPDGMGNGTLPDHASIKTPWEKLISFFDAYHYGLRHNAGLGALFFEVMRILIPDYEKRMERMAGLNYNIFYQTFASGFNKVHAGNHNVPPFVKGAMTAPLFGDSGDERLCMHGRVNDYGTYRVEKELDNCPFEIQGTEVCRLSALITEAIGDSFCQTGPEADEHKLKFIMSEARGAGDLHCRFIIESREKYPADDKPMWNAFEPAASLDQVQYTPEEKMVKEPQEFRGECDYKYRNGFNMESNATDQFRFGATNFILGANYVLPTIDDMIKKGETTQEEVENIFQCVFAGAGKMMFTEFFAAKGLRDWLGVPEGLNDGRVLGAYIEVLLQIWMGEYKVIAFNKDEVVYDITKLGGREHAHPLCAHAIISMWYGMARTLVGQRWFCERIREGVDEKTIRVKISKKIDKFAR
ncbi:MAG: hypothetical protein LBR77_09280 [Lachnospiraceae bacterium]|jgi:hypothetical protein|nr:hypothetical protein [Lachnospiraceae bacterium]